MKNAICTLFGTIGAWIAYALGGWDASVVTLLIFMAIDYASGFICAAVFHKSQKSKTGALESRAGWKGLCKKGLTILFVVIAVRLDLLIGTNYIRDAVCIAFIVNELISIVENAGLMGIPIPSVITKGIELLKEKGEENV